MRHEMRDIHRLQVCVWTKSEAAIEKVRIQAPDQIRVKRQSLDVPGKFGDRLLISRENLFHALTHKVTMRRVVALPTFGR